MRPSPDQIPLDQLEDGRVYKVTSRNLVVGAWRARTRSFIGLREKFDNRFLFEEFHYDNGPPFGTAWATQASNITTAIPERYWDPAKGDALRRLLMPLHFDILEEGRQRFAQAVEEAEILKWRPQTYAEHKREVAIDAVRQWRREIVAEVPPGEKRAERSKETHEEYVRRLTEAIKENPVD